MIRSEFEIWQDEINGRKPKRFSNSILFLLAAVGLCVLAVVGAYAGGVQ